jgi:hypothetical protein
VATNYPVEDAITGSGEHAGRFVRRREYGRCCRLFRIGPALRNETALVAGHELPKEESAVFTLNAFLADAAQVADGKLSVLGGGWSYIVPGGPFAVCGIIGIPWHLGTDWHHLRLELVDGDGHAVTTPGENGTDEPFVISYPPYRPIIGTHVKPGTSLGWPFAMNVAPGLPLETGSVYEWRFTIDEKTQEGWTLPFATFPAPIAEAA